MRGGVGEKSLRNVLELAGRVADRAAPQDRDAIHKLAGDVGAMADALCELRQNGQVRRGGTGGQSRAIGTPGCCERDYDIDYRSQFHCKGGGALWFILTSLFFVASETCLNKTKIFYLLLSFSVETKVK